MYFLNPEVYMKGLPAVLLASLCLSVSYGQRGRPSWLSNQNSASPSGQAASQLQSYPDATEYIQDDPGYDGYEKFLSDSNQYIDPNIFLFTNSGALGDAPLLPPNPPLLTNGSAQEIIDYIKSNNAFMEGQPQSNTGYQLQPKPQKERAFLDNRPEYELPKAAEGLWWRFYSQNTSIFNIPAAAEEMLVIAPSTGEAVWMQTIQTSGTVQSKSQRRLQIAMYLFNTGPRNSSTPLWFFYYPSSVYSENPNPDMAEAESYTKRVQNFPITNLQTVNNTPAYFVRILPDQGFMQMSKNPNFPADQTMFWRRYPREIPNIIAPPPKTNETLASPKSNALPEAADTNLPADAYEGYYLPEAPEGTN